MENVSIELLTRDAPGGTVVRTEHHTQSNATGAFRLAGVEAGRYVLCGTPAPAQASTRTAAVSASCYPGTNTVADAQVIVVGQDQSRDISITMRAPARLATVSGTARDANGRPLASGSVRLAPREGFPFRFAAIQPNGRFAIGGVPPGEYVGSTINVSSNQRQYSPDRSVAAVRVRGEDVADVVLVPVKAVTVSGRLIIPNNSTISTQTRFIRLGTVDASPLPLVEPLPPAPVVNPDLTFRLAAPALPVFVQVLGAGSLIAKAVRIGGQNVIDKPIDLRTAHDVSGVEIELTESPSLTATATGPGGRAATDWCLLVFPQDRAKWTTPPDLGRSFAALWHLDARPFAIRTLAPGRYYAAALNHVENGWRDPEFLETLRTRASAFELADGERKALALQLISVP